MSKAKLAAARELIQEKNYGLARSLLRTINDDPTALVWLAKLDKIAPDENSEASFPKSSKSNMYPQKTTYEFKTVTVGPPSRFHSADNAVNKKVDEMSQYGWELINMIDVSHAVGIRRQLTFRRAKRT